MVGDDTLWKNILEDVFDDFLRFFIPGVDDLLDFSKGITYLDKELDQLFPPEGDKNKLRYVDKLVKVYTREGDEEWILVHIEVQGYKDKQFGKRMFQYYTRIWDKYDRSIVSFAIFTDADRNFNPSVFEQSFLGTSICYKFNSYKVLDQSEAALQENPNPFALLVLMAQAALKKNGGMSDRELLRLKIDLARRLQARQISDVRIGKIMNFLRYYVRFENPEMNNNFDQEVAVISKNQESMGIDEFLLHRAEKQGIQKGEALAKEKLIKNQLQKKQLSPEQIAEILEVPVALVLSIQENRERP